MVRQYPIVSSSRRGLHASFSLIATFYYFSCCCIFKESYAYQPGGIQSGPDSVGSAFASSAIYDINKNIVLVTGSTYGHTFDSDGKVGHVFEIEDKGGVIDDTTNRHVSTCFLATVQLPNSETSSNGGMVWLESQTIQKSERLQLKLQNPQYHTPDEKCSTLLLHQNFLLVGGSTINEDDTSSTLQELVSPGQATPSNTTGLLIQFNRAQVDIDGHSIPVVGGFVITSPRVIYPVELYGGAGDTYLYVAQQVSTSTKTTMDVITDSSIVGTNDPYQSFPIGKPLMIQISQFYWKTTFDDTPLSPKILQKTLSSGWTKTYSTKNYVNAYVTGIVEVLGSVIVVGYTSGIGTIFGAVNTTSIDGSYDGFVSKLDKATGDYLGKSTTLPTSSSDGFTRRIASPTKGYDKIMSVCVAKPSIDSSSIYIVGYTSGVLDPNNSIKIIGTRAFVMKLSLDTLQTIWVKEIGVTNDSPGQTSTTDGYVQGMNCAVTPDGTEVWVGGNIAYNGILSTWDDSSSSKKTKSYGLTDVFVSKLNSSTGEIQFTRQIGSTQIDTIAPRKGLLVDTNGNAIVIGTTFGSMYRTRHETTNNNNTATIKADVFVTTISKTNGNTAKLVADTSSTTTGSAVIPPIPVPVFVPTRTPTGFNNEYSGSTSNSTNNNNNPASSKENDDDKKRSSLIATLVLLIIGTIVACVYINYQSTYNRSKDVVTDRAKVLPYMSNFDVEEIDLKHSATGGWHCSYAGDLARGKNHKTDHHPNNASLYNNNNSSNFYGNKKNSFIRTNTADDDDDEEPVSTYNISSGLLSVGGGGLDGYSKVTTERNTAAPSSSLFGEDNDDDDDIYHEAVFRSSSTRNSGYNDLISSEYNTTWGRSDGTAGGTSNKQQQRNRWGNDII